MTTARRADVEGRLRARRVGFVLVCLACLLAAVLYVLGAVTRQRSTRQAREESGSVSDSLLPRAAGPLVLFTNLSGSEALRYRAALAPITRADASRALTGLSCERVHFAGGHGVCLGEGGGMASMVDRVTSTHAYVFGPDFHITHDISLGGVPSRVRVSPDGHRGAATVFTAGHSYAAAGFSTATTLLDLDSGRAIGNLEAFAVWRNGLRFQSVDFNFWGVTFARDGDRFYATLQTGAQTYLVEGSVSARRMDTLRENVECPSLSPDGTRLAFKKRMSGAGNHPWRFHVLDLATMRETALAEPRSIDDQIEWLDDRKVLYGDGRTIWVADANGAGTPRKFLSGAVSPAMLRGEGLGAALTSAATNGLTPPSADLDVRIGSASDDVAVEGRVTYTVTVTNKGPSDASMLKVDQILTPGLSPIGVPVASNPGRGYGCSRHDPQHLSCDTLALARGAVWTMSFTARAAAAGTQSVHVIVSGAETDPDSSNDDAEARTTVHAAE